MKTSYLQIESDAGRRWNVEIFTSYVEPPELRSYKFCAYFIFQEDTGYQGSKIHHLVPTKIDRSSLKLIDLANLRTGISEVFFEVLNFENLHFGGTVNCAVLF